MAAKLSKSICLLIGLGVGFAMATLIQSRYCFTQVQRLHGSEWLVRGDKWTGKTWFYASDSWRCIPETSPVSRNDKEGVNNR